VIQFPKAERFGDTFPKKQVLGDFLQHGYKLHSMIRGYLLLSIADKVGKLTNNIKEKCNFKLKFVNDQQQALLRKDISHP
jgi:hypothetical protein